MTNLDLLRLHAVLQSLRGLPQPLPGRFAVTAAYNARVLEPAVEAIKEACKGPWDEAIQLYNDERMQLIEAYGSRSEDGSLMKVVSPDGSENFVPKDKAEWEQAFLAFKADKHPNIDEAFVNRALRIREVESEEAPPIPIRKVKLEMFPEDLTMLQADALMSMVEY